jgi:hypothetical protein
MYDFVPFSPHTAAGTYMIEERGEKFKSITKPGLFIKAADTLNPLIFFLMSASFTLRASRSHHIGIVAAHSA